MRLLQSAFLSAGKGMPLAVLVIAVFVIVTAVTMYFALRKCSEISRLSNSILNKFEPDNTAPKITELIEFHKANEKVKYIVD